MVSTLPDMAEIITHVRWTHDKICLSLQSCMSVQVLLAMKKVVEAGGVLKYLRE